MKTILVAVDGSGHTMKAVDFAADLAERFGSKLVMLTVYKHVSGIESTHFLIRPERTDGALPSSAEALRELAQEVVEAAAEWARERGVESVVNADRRRARSSTTPRSAAARPS